MSFYVLRKKGHRIETYCLGQAALPIVKKCGVFERTRSIFCGLPQCSQLLSLQNCSSNRTGSSAKDLICTRTIRISSQHFLLARILLVHISTYTRLWLDRKSMAYGIPLLFEVNQHQVYEQVQYISIHQNTPHTCSSFAH
jgi:hypothetical protein